MDILTENITSSEVPPVNLTSLGLLLSDYKTVLSTFNVLIGLSIHSYVLWNIITGRGIVLEFFNFNLTVCEIIYCLDCLIYILLRMFPCLTILHRFVQGFTCTARPLFECLICVERYLAVVHPVIFLKYKPLRYRLIYSIAAWIFSLGSCLGCMITSMLFYKLAFTWFFSILFLVLFPIQLFCLLAVLRVLKQSGPGERGREREEENHMKKRAFNIILITTVNMIIMFVPYIISGFLTLLAKMNVHIIWFIAFFCFTLTAFVQPVLYLHRVGKLFC